MSVETSPMRRFDVDTSPVPCIYVVRLGAYVKSVQGASSVLSLAALCASLASSLRAPWKGASIFRERLEDATAVFAWTAFISTVAETYEGYSTPDRVQRFKRVAWGCVSGLGSVAQIGLLLTSWNLCAWSPRQRRLLSCISCASTSLMGGCDVIRSLWESKSPYLSLQKRQIASLTAVKSVCSIAAAILSLYGDLASAPRWAATSVVVLSAVGLGAELVTDVYLKAGM